MIIENGTYCVYMHIAPNGKMYIGQTLHGEDPDKRWKGGNGYKDCTYFNHAIKKYGWENISHKVIAHNLTLDEANTFEALLIKLFDTTNPSNGYNLRTGGANSRLSEETKRKIGMANTKPDSEKFKTKYKNVSKKKNNRKHAHRDIAVVCVETMDIFLSIKSAADAYNLDASSITACCKGKQNTVGGYHWMYASEVDNLDKIREDMVAYKQFVSKCIDCGHLFTKNGVHDTRTIRCPECNEIYQKKRSAAKSKALRERKKKNKMVGD